MAEHFQTIIDTRARADEADHLARHVVSFLSGKGIIAPTADQEGGYRRGERALEIANAAIPPAHETIPPVHSHLQVMIGRATHAADMSSTARPQAHCPACGSAFREQDDLWREAEQEWLAGDDEAFLDCPTCQIGGNLVEWGYGTDYGFGNLAFRFWNWPPLSADFLEEIRRELQHPIVLVKGKL
jgi:uncharacterized C2H2 Zn-finger protein